MHTKNSYIITILNYILCNPVQRNGFNFSGVYREVLDLNDLLGFLGPEYAVFIAF